MTCSTQTCSPLTCSRTRARRRRHAADAQRRNIPPLQQHAAAARSTEHEARSTHHHPHMCTDDTQDTNDTVAATPCHTSRAPAQPMRRAQHGATRAARSDARNAIPPPPACRPRSTRAPSMQATSPLSDRTSLVGGKNTIKNVTLRNDPSAAENRNKPPRGKKNPRRRPPSLGTPPPHPSDATAHAPALPCAPTSPRSRVTTDGQTHGRTDDIFFLELAYSY